MLTRQRSKSFHAVGQTDSMEGQLQSSSASTIPLQSLQDRDQQEFPTEQLQEPNPSAESPQSRSSRDSTSNLVDISSDDIFAGIRFIAVSAEFSTIHTELVKLRSSFSSFNIEIIDLEDRAARLRFASRSRRRS